MSNLAMGNNELVSELKRNFNEVFYGLKSDASSKTFKWNKGLRK
jgi:hypothetical protein